jgi:hypothetical protein
LLLVSEMIISSLQIADDSVLSDIDAEFLLINDRGHSVL